MLPGPVKTDCPCAVLGCSKGVHPRHGARGLCAMHYQRWRTTGDPGEPEQRNNVGVHPLTRFWAKVDTSGECWLWLGSRTCEAGYGRFHADGRMVQAHRYLWELSEGPIPEKLVLDHLCLTKLCVRPSHLEVVTVAENTRRWWATRKAAMA